MIRDGRLEWLQVMRSNDLIWGTPINFVQFTYLQEIMAGWLGVNVGSYVHVSDSLHVYQRHWDELDRLDMRQDEAIPTNRTDLRIEGYKEWEDVWELVADVVLDLTKVVTPDLVSGVMNRSDDLPAGYREWIALLAAESLRRSNFDVEAGRIIDRAGEYWATSWRRWHRRKSLPQPSNCPGAQSK
jgi:thymidylate synthase